MNEKTTFVKMFAKAVFVAFAVSLLAGFVCAGFIDPETGGFDGWSKAHLAKNFSKVLGVDVVERKQYEGLRENVENLEDNQNLLSRRFSKLAEMYNNLVISEGPENRAPVIRPKDVLINPTFRELEIFLERNKVDQNHYTETGDWKSNYVCADFAEDLQWYANVAGFRSAYVELVFEEGAPYLDHAVNAFETIDRGLVYVNPQNDRIYESEENLVETYEWRIVDIAIRWQYEDRW